MAAPCGGIHPLALIGQPPEHREHRDRDPRDFEGVVVHDRALIEAFVTVDAGIEEATYIGPGAWLMKHVHVGHDAEVQADCELAPGTVIGGHAVLEEGVRCGIGVLVLPFKRVGAGARLGAGAVVTRDVPAGEVWVGNPAMEISQAAELRRVLGEAMQFDAWAAWWEARGGDAEGTLTAGVGAEVPSPPAADPPEVEPVCNCGGHHSAYVGDRSPGAGHAVNCPVRLAHPWAVGA